MSKLKKSIIKIRRELTELGLMLPGGISKQWYICRKKGCRCMDTENPRKHGPYHQLSYRIAGKSSTMIVKDEDLREAKKLIKNHQRFKELNKELLKAHVALIRAEGFQEGEFLSKL
jgi:Na+/phosphate symporter